MKEHIIYPRRASPLKWKEDSSFLSLNYFYEQIMTPKFTCKKCFTFKCEHFFLEALEINP